MIAEMHYPERIYSRMTEMAAEKKILSPKKAVALLKYPRDKPLKLKAEDTLATL